MKKQKRQLGKIFQAVVLRHVLNQCLGGSKRLLMPKDGLQSTDLIEKRFQCLIIDCYLSKIL